MKMVMEKFLNDELLNGLQYFLESEGEKLKNDVNLIFNNIDTNHNNLLNMKNLLLLLLIKKVYLIKIVFNLLLIILIEIVLEKLLLMKLKICFIVINKIKKIIEQGTI